MRIKQMIPSLILLAFGSLLSAKELKYPVSDIPPALKANAHTVIRLHQEEVEIRSEKEVIVRITEVRTILNKNGEDNALFIEEYDAMSKLSGIEGYVYDESGKKIKSMSTSDIVDRSAISGFSLYEDNRVKMYDPKNRTYPFTVEYSYDRLNKQGLALPVWSLGDENTSYQDSKFIVKTPADYILKYKEYNLPNQGVKKLEDGKLVYSWSISNLPARIHEPMPSIGYPNSPLVLLTPQNFVFDGRKGTAGSWKEIGMWGTQLLEGRENLPESTKQKMKEITSSCKTGFEKVQKVYEYMQQKCRYVNVTIGIGGLQPLAADVVDKNSYGDCKALSNYTVALLKSIGIKSHYVWVRAGEKISLMDSSFPVDQTNHVMVCVPLEKDTVWLECTNQRMPCGYNGDFTDDRDVLLVDGENSRLVHTRVYSAAENCTSRHSKLTITDETGADAKVNTRYLGLCYDEIMPIFFADDADKKKQLTQRINIPSFELKIFSYRENRSRTPWFDESIDLHVNNPIQKLAGDVYLLPLNFMNKLTSIPEKVRNRKSDMCVRRAYLESDTVEYQLPTNFQVSELPAKQEIAGKFGKYSASVSQQGNKLSYTRHFELLKGTFPPEAYAEFRDFLEQIAAADNAVASLKKD